MMKLNILHHFLKNSFNELHKTFDLQNIYIYISVILILKHLPQKKFRELLEGEGINGIKGCHFADKSGIITYIILEGEKLLNFVRESKN